MLKAEVLKSEVAGAQKKELDDSEIIKIIKKMVKQRHDSIEQFEKGGRSELAASEIEILEKYLPPKLPPEKLAEIIAAKKSELGISDKSKMGILIGAVIREAGESADGTEVKIAVEKSFE